MTKVALRLLARRVQHLEAEIAAIEADLDTLVAAVAPELLTVYGCGVHSASLLLVAAGDNPDRLRNEAAWAHLCGVAPIPASSGKTPRYRLNRGGDRQANHALHRIAMVRMRHDARTQDYVARRRDEGHSQRDPPDPQALHWTSPSRADTHAAWCRWLVRCCSYSTGGR